MKNNYCVDLNLEVDVDLEYVNTLVQEAGECTTHTKFTFPKEKIDSTISNFLDTLNIRVIGVELFILPPQMNSIVHIDGVKLDNHCKLNWSFGARGSLMRWYQTIDQHLPEITPTDKYIAFDIDDCIEVFNSIIGTPSLVNVGVPHDVTNTTDEYRITLCYILNDKDMDNHNRLSFSDAYDRFLNYVRVKGCS